MTGKSKSSYHIDPFNRRQSPTRIVKIIDLLLRISNKNLKDCNRQDESIDWNERSLTTEEITSHINKFRNYLMIVDNKTIKTSLDKAYNSTFGLILEKSTILTNANPHIKYKLKQKIRFYILYTN